MTATAAASEARADSATWTRANQRSVVAELSEVTAALARHAGVEPPPAPHRSAGAEAESSAVDVVADAFGLSPFERSILLLCAGVELDAGHAALCASSPTFGLALAALPDPHWSALAPDGPLRRWRLVQVADHGPLTAATLRIDEYVLHYLTGLRGPDAKLTGIVGAAAAEPGTTPLQDPAAHRVADLWRVPGGPVPVLTGGDRWSRLAVAAHAARDLGTGLSTIDPRVIPVDPAAREELARLLERHCVLAGTAFLVDHEPDTDAAVDALVSLTSAPVAVSAGALPALRRRATVLVDVPRPSAAEQHDLWLAGAGPDAPAAALAAAFNLDAASIAATVTAAGGDPDALWTACRAVDRPDLSTHAQRVESAASWDDLVLQPVQRQTLELLTAHARHRVTVYDEWGLRMGRDTGLGSTAVFGGPSGTGKTFAAEVVANDLSLDLYRVDLSAVVSKYIGETEKNLRRVFDAADHGAAVLLFDEADALFGKRTEVRDSHDRYANVEVSYLLQRMEAYRGLAILTTNMADALDAAFLRRIRFLVSFPFPDRAMRLELWRRAFPAATPTSGLDLDALATLDLAGGTIRNVAVNAAFLAAHAGEPVGMGHVVQAARIECSKLGQPMPSLTWESP
ncbi:ATP-binding protein [Nocardioides taihuensis]|uniref:ATP-binding protein n=1 Tax=Nocardioides taihuensis TaxID=1835606 RepID=A0ABW0BEV2_9ACTN